MGNGASIEFERHQACRLFCNDRLKTAVGKLSTDPEERLLFSSFVKEGVWLDDICLNMNFKGSQKEESLVSERSLQLFCGYIVPSTFSVDMENSIRSRNKDDHFEQDEVAIEESGKTVNSRNSTPRNAICESEKSATDSTKTVEILPSGIASAWAGLRNAPSNKQSSVRGFHLDYAHLDSTGTGAAFSKFQLLFFLFAILHPLYETHRHSEGASSKESSMMCFMDIEGQCRCTVPCKEPATLSAEAVKAQELLLAAAAHHDEERMLHHLSSSDWLTQVQSAFHECKLGISICDARTGSGFPILYANAALQSMTGHSMKQLFGRTFHILQGPDTELEQVSRMSSALKLRQSTRVVLTNYRRNGSKFVNMLALKPVFDQTGEFCYVIGVSYDIAQRGASLSDLQQVDTVVALLPLIIAS